MKKKRNGVGWYVLGAAGLLGGARLVRGGGSRGVLGGFAAGAGLTLLALLEARRAVEADRRDGERKAPSFARRVAASIPFRAKASLKS